MSYFLDLNSGDARSIAYTCPAPKSQLDCLFGRGP
jgi:hypothetical protein